MYAQQAVPTSRPTTIWRSQIVTACEERLMKPWSIAFQRDQAVRGCGEVTMWSMSVSKSTQISDC